MFLKLYFGLKLALLISNIHTSSSHINACGEKYETKYFENLTPYVVHRIDKNTSGILIIAKNRKYAQLFTSLFRIRKIHKTYLAIVYGKLDKSIKSILLLLGLPQTTYNKKKSEQALLDSRDSELILSIVELIDYGLEVFNYENEKFYRWLKKNNLSMNGNSPESMLDTITGINEVQACLNRIEYGNLA